MHQKFIRSLLKRSWSLFFWLCLIAVPLSLHANGGEPVSPVPSHNDLGIVDINQGLEAAHHPAYKFFEANYQQGLHLGAAWNRWEVNWAAVEQKSGIFNWVCKNTDCLAPDQGHGNYFDYLKLASTDEVLGLHSLVILTEIPECYKADNTIDPKRGCYIAEPGDPLVKGLNNNIFLLQNGYSTDDPHHPDIHPDSPILVSNRWAWFVYQTMEQLGPLGVHHWQVMNEMNINLLWERNNAINNYVRMVEIVSKLIIYRQVPDKIIVWGLAYQYNVPTNLGLNPWGRTMFIELNGKILLGNIEISIIDPKNWTTC